MQDEPVALAGQREDPAGVAVAQPDRADEKVEVPLLRGHLDAPVDQVGELQARLFVFEDTVGRHSDLGPADHHPDDLLEPGAQCPGRPVRDEAKLGRGPLDPFPGVGQWVAAAVEHAGHRGDGHARGPRHVVDGGRAVLGVAVRRQHARHRSRGTGDAGALLHVAPGRGRAVIAEVGAWPAGKRLPSRPRKWRSRERLQFRASVSAYQPSCAERTTDSPGASRPARHRYVNVTLPPMPGAKPQSAADSVLELGRLGQPETSPKSSRPPASGPFLLA